MQTPLPFTSNTNQTKNKEMSNSMFTDLENDKPFVKLALEGFAGDGKTRTAAEIAIGIHKLIHSDKPIAIYDTEQAAKALKPLFDREGIKAISSKNRTLASLNEAIKWCESGGSDILVIDSITHVWENFVEAYKSSKKYNKTFLEFQDWGIIKPRWKTDFSNLFVQSNVHIIFTGRAGYEYTDEKNEQTGKREIFKSGIKMKAEGETAFEPDVLVLMEKVQDILGDVKKIYRTATIIKDRTDKIDGVTLNHDGLKKGPDFGDFYPAIAALLDGEIKKHTGNEIPDTFEDWESKFSKVGKAKDTAIAEIEGAFNLMKLGTSKEDKALKAAVLKQVFTVLSTDNLRTLDVKMLDNGMSTMKDFADKYNAYMQTCLEATLQPDMQEIKKLLEQCMADNNPNALNEAFNLS